MRRIRKTMSASLPHPPVICVCGCKKSGKTLLVARLVRYFADRGLSVGTIKHDGHDFDLGQSPDREGTDSWRHRAAGARASAVFSSKRWALFRDGEPALGTILASMADMDLILVEGLKGSAWPKIVVYGEGERPEAAEPILAVVSREPVELPYPRFRPDEVEAIAARIRGLLGKGANDSERFVSLG